MIGVLVGSVLLPPMGIIWGFKYLKKENPTTKLVGGVAIVLTLAVLVSAVFYTSRLINTINQQLNTGLMNLDTF